MKILVSGASGLVGTSLVPRLEAAGHDVRALARGRDQPKSIHWNVATGELDEAALDLWGSPEAVIHLAGENIGTRWTAERKRNIRASRVEATQKLAAQLVKRKLRVFIGASAVGYYGNRGDEILTERSPGGTGFLADVCEGWEHAAERLMIAGVRVVRLRFGMILSRKGGALAKMLPIFRAGLGGKLGSGRQWMSWIALEDLIRVVEFCLEKKNISGAYNTDAPNPVQNKEFTAELARVLKRPAIFPAPAFALRMLYGEMADAMLLSSLRVLPERLEEAGFDFEFPRLSRALEAALYKN